MTTKENRINEWFDNAHTWELMGLIQDIHSWNGAFEYLSWEDMASFDDYFSGVSPLKIAEIISYSKNFNAFDDYFGFDSLGNLESGDESDVDNCIRDNKEEIIDTLLSGDIPTSQIGDIWLRDILEEDDEDEEE